MIILCKVINLKKEFDKKITHSRLNFAYIIQKITLSLHQILKAVIIIYCIAVF